MSGDASGEPNPALGGTLHKIPEKLNSDFYNFLVLTFPLDATYIEELSCAEQYVCEAGLALFYQ
jgi:hypothetical protein